MSRPLLWQEQREVVDTCWILGLILLRVHSALLRKSPGVLPWCHWTEPGTGLQHGRRDSAPHCHQPSWGTSSMAHSLSAVTHTLLFNMPMPAGVMCHHQPTLPQKEPANLHGDGFLKAWILRAERITPSNPEPAFALHFSGDSLWMLHWLLNSSKSWRWS